MTDNASASEEPLMDHECSDLGPLCLCLSALVYCGHVAQMTPDEVLYYSLRKLLHPSHTNHRAPQMVGLSEKNVSQLELKGMFIL